MDFTIKEKDIELIIIILNKEKLAVLYSNKIYFITMKFSILTNDNYYINFNIYYKFLTAGRLALEPTRLCMIESLVKLEIETMASIFKNIIILGNELFIDNIIYMNVQFKPKYIS